MPLIFFGSRWVLFFLVWYRARWTGKRKVSLALRLRSAAVAALSMLFFNVWIFSRERTYKRNAVTAHRRIRLVESILLWVGFGCAAVLQPSIIFSTHRCSFDPGGGFLGRLVTQFLEGPFSALSKPTFPTTGSLCSIFQDLED